MAAGSGEAVSGDFVNYVKRSSPDTLRRIMSSGISDQRKSYIQDELNRRQTGLKSLTVQEATKKYAEARTVEEVNLAKQQKEVVSTSQEIQNERVDLGGGRTAIVRDGKVLGVEDPFMQQSRVATFQDQVAYNQLKSQQSAAQPPPNTISAAQDRTFGEAVSYLKTNIRKDPYEAIKGSAQIAIASVRKPVAKETETLNQMKEIDEGLRKDKLTFYENPKGTRIDDKQNFPEKITYYQKYTDEELINTSDFSEEAKIRAISKRISEQRQEEYNLEMQEYATSLVTELKNKVDSGKIETEEELNNEYKKIEDKVEKHGKNLADTKYKELSEEDKKYLAKVQGKIILNKVVGDLPIYVGAGLITGGAASVLAATGATGSLIVSGANVAALGYGGYQVQKAVGSGITGELTKEQLIAMGLEFGAFYAGTKGGAKITSSVISVAKLEPIKLQNVLKYSDIKVKTTSLTGEAELKLLEIPEGAKAEVTGRIKGGSSARIIEADIKAATTEGQKILETYLPERNIKFVELTDSAGNVVQRIALGKIKLGKGKDVFKQDVLVLSEGGITTEGVLETDTLTLLGNKKTFPSEAVYTKETSRGMIKGIDKKGLLRLVQTKSGVKIIEEAKSLKKGRPLTQKQIQDLMMSEKEGRPISEAEFLELQRITGMAVGKLRVNEKTLAFASKDFVGKGKGTSRGASDTTIKISKLPTERKEIKPEVLNQRVKSEVKKIDRDLVNNQKVNKQIKELEEGQPLYVGGTDAEAGIKARMAADMEKQIGYSSPNIDTAVRQAIKDYQINLRYPKVSVSPIAVGAGSLMIREELDMKQLMKQSNELLMSNEMLMGMDNIKIQEKVMTEPQIRSLSRLRQKQAQKQQARLKQVSPNIQVQQNIKIPETKIPKLNLIDFDKIENIRVDDFDKQLRKLSKRQPKYTASLSEAALSNQYLELTEKQLEELDKSVFSGFERRPVIKIKSSKKKTKKKKR